MDKDLADALSIMQRELKKKVKDSDPKDQEEFAKFLEERIIHSNNVIIENSALLDQLKKDASSEGKIDPYTQKKIEGAEGAIDYWKLCRNILRGVRESLV